MARQDRITIWIERDINIRGLRAGEPYLTAAEVGTALGVSRATADRAMRSLADRQVLVRKQRSGTFVGSGVPGREVGRELESVHVLVSVDYLRAAITPVHQIVEALMTALPRARVQLECTPEQDPLPSARRIVEELEGRETRDAVVLIRCPHDVQRLVERSSLPAVVFGSVYPDVERLPSIDIDQHAAGRVVGRYLLDEGFRDVVFFTRDQWRRGDNLLHTGLSQVLAEADVPLDQLEVCSVPPSPTSLAENAERIIAGAESPMAVVCRDHRFAEAIHRAASSPDHVGGPTCLAIAAHTAPPHAPYASLEPSMSPAEQLRWLVDALDAFARGGLGPDRHRHVETSVVPAPEMAVG